MAKASPEYVVPPRACEILGCSIDDLKRLVIERSLDLYVEATGWKCFAVPWHCQDKNWSEPHIERFDDGHERRTYRNGSGYSFSTQTFDVMGTWRISSSDDRLELINRDTANHPLWLAPVSSKHAADVHQTHPEIFQWSDFRLIVIDKDPANRITWNDVLFRRRDFIQAKNSRADSMKEELELIIQNMQNNGLPVNPASVMDELKRRAGSTGSCVVETFGDGVIWTRLSNGQKEKLDTKILRSRLDRMKQ